MSDDFDMQKAGYDLWAARIGRAFRLVIDRGGIGGERMRAVRLHVGTDTGDTGWLSADETTRLALALAGCDAATQVWKGGAPEVLPPHRAPATDQAWIVGLDALDAKGATLFRLRFGQPPD